MSGIVVPYNYLSGSFCGLKLLRFRIETKIAANYMSMFKDKTLLGLVGCRTGLALLYITLLAKYVGYIAVCFASGFISRSIFLK